MRTGTPLWQARHQLIGDHMPSELRSWLFEPGSLTRRLRGLCPDHFSLTLLGSERARPLHDERRTLGLATGRSALIRQVYLRCRERYLVFARSVIPAASLRGANRRLAWLGERPLAGVLFGPVAAERGVLEVACLTVGHPLYTLATRQADSHPPVLWARRSLFYPGRKPVLVTEVFFPELADLV